MNRRLGIFLSCACLSAFGCGGGPQLGRIGPSLPLPSGGPRNACEREQWYEVAPARLHTVLPAGTVSYHQLHVGAGIFETGKNDPVPLQDVWPKLQQPVLQERHQARIAPVDAANRRASYWFLGGLGGLGAGLGTGFAVRNESKDVSTGLIVSGVVIGLVGLTVAYVIMPGPEEQLAANARRQLFMRGEDDLGAVARGVNHANGQRREECGGTAAEFAEDTH